jgi:hypothetical protein
MENGGIPNGCGNLFKSQLFFITFVSIVVLISLNLFLSIVVDTYHIRKEENSVAVKNLDIETF